MHLDQLLSSYPSWGKSSSLDDVRTAQSLRTLFAGADKLIELTKGDLNTLLEIEKDLFQGQTDRHPLVHLIVKAAISRVRVLSFKYIVNLEIVVPMYHEAIRLAPRATSTEQLMSNPLDPHEHGEDALLRKYLEIEWLTRGSLVFCHLVFVDDICDQGSGFLAQRIIDHNKLLNCEVLFLSDEIKLAQPGSFMFQALQTVIEGGESIRGGSLCLGFAKSIELAEQQKRLHNTVISYVDADSSYSLTQLGIPLWQIENSNSIAVTASRQHQLTYLERSSSASQTSSRSPGLIRLKQIVGYLRKSILGEKVPADTQSGFKFFKPHALKKILAQDKKAHNFSFDTQLLARIDREFPGEETISTFGVVCIDCDELSTANNGLTYFYALKILQVISEETNIDNQKDVQWLLDYLCRDINNYKLAIKLLEDDALVTQEVGKPYPNEQLLQVTRQKIRITKDTTAVGDYFTSDIAQDLKQVLQEVEKISITSN